MMMDVLVRVMFVTVAASGMMMSIGQEMMMRHQMKQPMPDLVKEESSDSPDVKKVKEAIQKMTKFAPKDRIEMIEVMKIINPKKGRTVGVDCFSNIILSVVNSYDAWLAVIVSSILSGKTIL